MIRRLARVRREFGLISLLQVVLLGVAACALCALAFPAGSGVPVLVATTVTLVVCFLAREVLVENVGRLGLLINGSIAAYFVVLVLGDVIGIEGTVRLVVIATTTAALFSFHFWVKSDPRVERVRDPNDVDDDDEWERG